MTEQTNDPAAAFDAARARLLALAYRMLGSRAEAEDIVQDAWLKWQSASTDEVRTPAAWLTTITTRLAIDRLRHLQYERALQNGGVPPQPWLDEFAPSAEELALRAAELSSGVLLLLERLKPEERAAFVLHEAFDCEYADIAKILDRPPSTCRQIVHRAKSRLQRAGAPLPAADPAAHTRLVEQLREAIDEQDRASLLRLFGALPEVVDDALDTVATTTFVASMKGCAAEAMSMDDTPGLALLRAGEIVAWLDITADDCGTGTGAIAALRVVTDATSLRAANAQFGLFAVQRLLKRIRARSLVRPSVSVTVCGDFPVDVDA
ncbi:MULTISPECIES: sigma-70 family RNA polymerase sigma factor [Paraburkholderia]|uniref:sigma-70 family RNA polymerase sigma factor n=1 Tax=Paraburkholderia TaxID=1822464 RepID=UPI0022553DD9|nr:MULTISPECIES: sigma-70 family RNA polymerase sigma factor [Paraburkholderia]MCX4161123.1 sigma-70 family RNA polymerase sigma factor [Paraburkholderia megapolitana]MDN7156619.1 sigma-70 family RNA polymerase sigma factor [Paraburkholderia sp. CHISQ3]MDQ6493664.1 sigma-70 family RNA polymerase sigma factor [Paraburkholderia megapolitana]